MLCGCGVLLAALGPDREGHLPTGFVCQQVRHCRSTQTGPSNCCGALRGWGAVCPCCASLLKTNQQSLGSHKYLLAIKHKWMPCDAR